jgi:hypothetical protein
VTPLGSASRLGRAVAASLAIAVLALPFLRLLQVMHALP